MSIVLNVTMAYQTVCLFHGAKLTLSERDNESLGKNGLSSVLTPLLTSNLTPNYVSIHD